MRILHFSDVHIGLGLLQVPVHDWPGKRLAGGFNLLRGRGRHFAEAAEKARGLVVLDEELSPDLVLCTGDLTALGTQAEFETAHELLEPLMDARRFVVTPGNHDLYTRTNVQERRFEEVFEEGIQTDLADLRTDGSWPLVRLPADDVAIVAVNSARPLWTWWRSSGRIPEAQIEGLRSALADPRVAGRFTFLMTHYAPCRADGTPDSRDHGLRNLAAFLDAASPIDRGALLCGHVHNVFRQEIAAFAGEVFCAGSATYEGREGVWVFDRDERGVWHARRGRWNGENYDVEAEGAPVAGQEVG